MLRKFVGALLALTLVVVDLGAGLTSQPVAMAAQTPSITMSATVSTGSAGRLDARSTVLSDGEESRINVRLTPNYSTGAATDVRVTVFLPYLDHVDGEYRVVNRGTTPTDLGVQGRAASGGGWNVIGDTTVRGGPIVLEYEGDLQAGSNPAFDLNLTTYNDGSDGPFGAVPEGTIFELNGFVSYKMFDRVEGTSWSTPNELDDESRVSLISSDLRWESSIESHVVPAGASDLVPLWDRYQYIDYVYELANTSENQASNIDGYSVTFDIQSTASDVNGIIPFDVNRWRYNDDGPPTANPELESTSGLFVGVPGQGGILVYDITDWDGEAELTDPIPYSYSGTGMIEIDRRAIDSGNELTPPDVAGDSARKYLLSVPLSRQGFPNPPTKFKISAITDVVFAKQAHWSKTSVSEREIVAPTYDFAYKHTTKQAETVYGYETFNEISELINNSNAPIFKPELRYTVDEDFDLDRVVYEIDENDEALFEDVELTYSYVDAETEETVTETVSPTRTETPGENEGDPAVVTLTFDLSHLADLDWDHTFIATLSDRVEAGVDVPVNIKVYGAPHRVGEMSSEANIVTIEKIASNDDFGQNTTYTEVEHEYPLTAEFLVIYPDEVVPEIEVQIDGHSDEEVVDWDATTVLDFLFGVNDTVAENTTTTLTVNDEVERFKDLTLILREEFFAKAEISKITYTTLGGGGGQIDLADYAGTGDFEAGLPADIATIAIETDELTSDGPVNFVSLSGRLGHELDKEHVVDAEFRTYQPKPYDKDSHAHVQAVIEIRLPNELIPEVGITGIYGDRKTQDKTNVGYESTFDVDYQLDTGGVTSPESTYTIELLPATQSGELEFQKLNIAQALIDGVDDYEIIFTSADGASQTFSVSEVSATDITLDDIESVVISSTNLSLDELQTIVTIEYGAHIELGSAQTVRATFEGTQQAPYEELVTDTANNVIEVAETRTTVDVKGVNQVTKNLGVGNDYTVDIHRVWSPGTYYSKSDNTLDQGYKSLGGFTSSFTRPTETYKNNDQRVSLNVDLPYEHFDLYYVKLRAELEDFVDTVDVYRMVEGEEVLWKSVPGDAWVENTQEGSGFWRINTARPDSAGEDLFATHDSVEGVENHPYYKDAWDADVRPEQPVSRVVVNLEFTRESNDAAPQLPGVNSHAVEYMGRFHSSSIDGKKATTLSSTDSFGTRTRIERTHTHSVNSLVAYPFAQSRTGAHDNTSLANKVISMGEVGEYLASVWNVADVKWSLRNGHGPDIYIPDATEYDEWLGERNPSSFHDELIYEFVYPDSPNDDDVYNLDPTHVVVADSTTLEFLTGVRVNDENGESVEIHFTQPLSSEARFEYDNSFERGIHDNEDGSFTISLGSHPDGEAIYPQSFEGIFEQVPGFGERTAEIDGVKENTLGNNLNEVDVRVGGVVNGNKALRGTTNLYRVPADTEQKTLLHTSSATLTGRTPRLGARLDLDFDGATSIKVYDYEADGITPQSTEVGVDIENSSEADIKDAYIALTPDTNFRTKTIEIPSDVFNGDWGVDSVTVKQGSKNVHLDLSAFVPTDTGRHVYDLEPLFADGTLEREDLNLTRGGEATVVKQHIDSIGIQFTPANDTIGMWGSLARELDPTLSAKMREGSAFYITGIWVDSPVADDGNPVDPWDSQPTFVDENTKASNEVRTTSSSFSVRAEVTSYQPIYASSGSGNNGEKPSLTRSHNTGAPRLYNRVARLQTSGTHLQNDYSPSDSTHLFYSPGTDAQIHYTNIAVGDTVKVLYELKNIGTTASDDNGPGALPVHKPQSHIVAPKHLRISSVVAGTHSLTALGARPVITDSGANEVEVEPGAVSIVHEGTKRSDVFFDVTLNDGESVFFVVEYEATNEPDASLGATQNQTVQWNVYSRPHYSHHYMSYDSVGVAGNRVSGSSATLNLEDDGYRNHAVGRVYNTNYRYANPNQLVIDSKFDTENISGESMTLTVKNIRNEILHDNTRLDLYLKLDRDELAGFELTELPEPQYPDGFTGQFAAPQVYYRTAEGDWNLVTGADSDVALVEITDLRIEYGVVPATYDGKAFEAPEFTVPGIGHWRAKSSDTAKYYDLFSQAQIVLTHEDTSGEDAATYSYTAEDRVRVYKAIPTVEFNIQSFDSLADAEETYDGSNPGKTSYRPGDDVVYKLTAQNIKNDQGTNTNTPYGKAPLLKPVIYDRIPEYVTAELEQFISGGELDVAAAIDAGALKIRVTGEGGTERSIEPPTATVATVTGLDIAGSQQFKNDRANDGWGLLSSTHPNNVEANPAAEISFDLITYEFAQDNLGRGETLEIIYPAKIRETNLPIGTYADGRPVFAPYFGWYGANNPVSNNAAETTMDMATLLHDAGITGYRGHEMTEAEFLSNSYSMLPGENTRRRQPTTSSTSTQATYYDASANTAKSHKGYLNENTTNDLYTAFNNNTRDDNYQWVINDRVQDTANPGGERILWSQDGIQLGRAWLYAGSEMLPDTQRKAYGVDDANFYEYDGSLNSYNRHRLGYTPYVEDDHSYAVELHEEFTVRLHAANLGDYPVTSGLEYTEILPLGITPYDEDGNLLGITAFDGAGAKIDSSYEILQTPIDDAGYRAPAQSQEARTYETTTRDDGIPYVVKVTVDSTLPGMFNSPGAQTHEKYQRVDIRVRVEGEIPQSENDISYWHDQFTLTTAETEPYVAIYDNTYGGFHAGIGTYNTNRYPNDGMAQGLDVNDLTYRFSINYTSYFAVEPWGMYIRGLNAQATAAETGPEGASRPAIVTGDQIAMRKPTLRVWSAPEKDEYSGDYDSTIEDFSVDLHEEFTIHSKIENQQLEVLGEYNRNNPGYNRYSGDNYSDDIWKNAPQTIGGARGSWFEPAVTIALPYGIAPVLDTGDYARYYRDVAELQDIKFSAEIHDITFDSTTPVKDVTEFFDVEVELVTHDDGEQFVLHFTTNTDRAADIAYGQSLVISPRVATIDTPLYNAESNDDRYQQVLTFANTSRPVFNPVVSDKYVTGAPTSLTARDQGNATSGANSVKSSNGKSITVNDRTRPDTTSVWNTNMGVLKITEQLIRPTATYSAGSSVPTKTSLSEDGELTVAASINGEAFIPTGLASRGDKFGAVGGTYLNLRKPSLTNTTKVANYADSLPSDLIQVDAAGKYWYSTQISNAPIENENPYEQIKTAGHVHNSRFVFTHFVTNFAVATGEVRIRVGDELYDRAELETAGYTVERYNADDDAVEENRNRIQWLVTPPAGDRGTRGELLSGDSFEFLYEVQLVDGYEDAEVTEEDRWSSEDLIVDSYVSLISDDATLSPVLGDPDFITQSLTSMKYHEFASDHEAGLDIDGEGEFVSQYAADDAEVVILKPRGEVRINTTRPRIAYSNGMSGDTYFNSSDVIEYLITHGVNTGSGLKEFAVETILPAHESNDPGVSVSHQPISTTALYATTGSWLLPDDTLERLEAQNLDIDDAFKTYLYVSNEVAEPGYETSGWTLLNPGGTSILENEEFEIPADQRPGLKKMRVVVKALQPDRFLVPQGTRLDIDADPDTDGAQSIVETDPENHATEQFADSVTDSAIAVGLRASSDARSTLFIYGAAEAWGNYVATRVTKLDESETRSYLTPSRPVVNVKYDALYYRTDSTQDESERYGWSDNVAIAPKSSPHLKFSGQFINADDSMWSREEDNAYAQDSLVDPFVTFELPAVLETGDFTYVPFDQVGEDHPLNDDYRSRYGLTRNENNLWTWRIERADGSPASEDSHLVHRSLHAGPWPGHDRNLLSVWFEGNIYPGDMIVVDFIGSVDAYAPGKDANDLKSRATITNNTGLLYPLNSRQNAANRLGYTTDLLDFNQNHQTTDRLVFSEKQLFQYETYDDFGKRKVAYSDLNRAGTVAPELTPVSEGGELFFEVSVNNSKSTSQTPYPYPIIYDVLPHEDDTSITNPDEGRGSKFSAWLIPDSLVLKREGTDEKTYSDNEYTVYVGPFTEQNGEIVDAPMVSHADAKIESFYDAVGEPGKPSSVRDEHFVELAQVADNPQILRRAKTILVLFNDPKEHLPGQSKLTLNYAMKAPLNAPAYLEQFHAPERRDDVPLWNSFMATQRVESFMPQESNKAGALITEQADNVYIGNYVWHDVNYNASQDEGDPFTDSNGRELLNPSIDLNFDGSVDDPGINGVRVSLLTPAGYNVDAVGNAVHFEGDEWRVVDEASGESVLDEVFDQPIVSAGPLVTETQTDFFGNDGYYTFSNIPEGDYRVLYEFPSDYDDYSVTTPKVFQDTDLDTYLPGEALAIPADVDDSRLVALSRAASVDRDTTDAERMSFDVGIARTILVGGTIFEENLDSLNGYQDANERGMAGYHVYFKMMDGVTAVDHRGQPLVAVTDENGDYEFSVLPFEREYVIEVTDRDDGFDPEMVVSPFVHNVDPFKESNDNDGYVPKDTQIVKTNPLYFDLEGLFETDFADRDSVSVGFYARTTYGVIGNRVWNDLNRDGIQNPNEPGVEGQELALEQYVRVDDEWQLTDYTQTTTSNADGFYYFEQVPSVVREDETAFETRYQVVVDELVPGYTFTLPREQAPEGVESAEVDSNFFANGTLHPTDSVGDYLVSVADQDETTGVINGLTDNTIDLGLVEHARSTLSGEVFVDTDRDGRNNDADTPESIYTASLEVRFEGEWVQALQDASGQMVEPREATAAHTPIQVSDAAAYEFENLHIIDSIERVPYEYRVRVTQIPRWQEVTQFQVGDDPAVDNDFKQRGDQNDTTNTAVSDSRILGELKSNQLHPIETYDGVPATHVDLGVFDHPTRALISGTIWNDTDENGFQTAPEPGLEKVTVVLNRLIDGDLVPVAQTQTDSSGRYEFTAEVSDYDPESTTFHTPYTYVVEFTLTSRQSLSPVEIDGQPTQSRFDYGNVDPLHTALSDGFTLADIDGDGLTIYESTDDETGVDGGVVIHETVKVIGDTVYEDRNADGTQNAGEPGISGLTARLFRQDLDSGVWHEHEDTKGVSTLVTDGSGNYEFAVEVADLDKDSAHYREAYEYRVLVEAPAHMRLVETGSVFSYTGDDVPSGITIERPFSFVLSDPVSLIDGGDNGVELGTERSDRTIDAGFRIYDQSVIIGGRVWEDANHDGVQNNDEAPTPDQAVHLWELVDGQWVRATDLTGADSVLTDADGRYEFEVAPTHYDEAGAKFLAPREYRVTTQKRGFQHWSPLHVGDDVTVDSDVEPGAEFGTVNTGVTKVFDIIDSRDGVADVSTHRGDTEMDIGITTHPASVTIGGRVWEDANHDGLRGKGEAGIADQVVRLWEIVDGAWLPAEDVNGLGSVSTNADGRYTFEVAPTHYDEDHPNYLEPREYRVTVQKRGFQHWSPLHVGDDATVDSDVESGAEFGTVNTGVTQVFDIVTVTDGLIDITSPRSDTHMDIGIKTHPATVTIGGRVWEDANHDGVQNNGETGTPDQAVHLWELVDGAWLPSEDVNGLGSVSTDASGHFEFEVAPAHFDEAGAKFLAPREYRVTVQKRGFQEWSPLHVGDDATVDSDVESGTEFGNVNTGVTQVFDIVTVIDGLIDITSPRADTHMDIGIKTNPASVTIGGRVWNDTNLDGLQGKGEPGMPGETVHLWELVDGEWTRVEDLNGVGSVETDADGGYTFEVAPTHYDEADAKYLQPREYRTTLELPNGFEVSSGSQNTTLDGSIVLSQTAQIASLGDDEQVDVASVEGDETLDFALAAVPVDATVPGDGKTPPNKFLPRTGAQLAILFIGLSLLTVGFVLNRGARKRRG